MHIPHKRLAPEIRLFYFRFCEMEKTQKLIILSMVAPLFALSNAIIIRLKPRSYNIDVVNIPPLSHEILHDLLSALVIKVYNYLNKYCLKETE